jgi:hypothetical protein
LSAIEEGKDIFFTAQTHNQYLFSFSISNEKNNKLNEDNVRMKKRKEEKIEQVVD